MEPARIALISQPGTDLRSIHHQFRNPARFVLREYHSLAEIDQHLRSFPFEILIIRVPVFVSSHVQMLVKVRGCFPEAGLITCSPDIDPSARFHVRQIQGHKLIQEPLETSDIERVVEKFIRGEKTALRLHPRTPRRDEVEVVDSGGDRAKARFLDFAQMGARVLVQTRQLMPKNTRVQLHYRSTSEPGRVHRIESVVVWEDVTGGMIDFLIRGPQRIVGLRFIAAL